MKLIINYDFFNAVKDVNEGFTPMKIVRNNKKRIAYFSVPIWFTMDYLATKSLTTSLKIMLFQFLIVYIGGEYSVNIILKEDRFKEISKKRLHTLALLLKKILIETDYKLLIQSELQEKKYKVHLSENKLPELIENKYILVPTYDFNGNIKNTSIKQEHIVGTNDYILSIGLPEKELKLAYANT